MWLATFTRQGKDPWSYTVSKRILTFGLLTLYFSGDGLHLWLLGALVYLTLLGTTLLKTVEVQTEYLDYYTRKYDHTLEMVFTRQTSRGGANPESPSRTHPETSIREIRTPSRTVFTQKQNELFIEKVLQCCQDVPGSELNLFLFLVWMSLKQKEVWKKPIIPWLFDFIQTKTSI